MRIKSTPEIEKNLKDLRNKGASIHVVRAANDATIIIDARVIRCSWCGSITKSDASEQLAKTLGIPSMAAAFIN